MQRFTEAIRHAVSSHNWFGALFLALNMPDICAKLEDPAATGSSARYQAWFDRHLAKYYKAQIAGSEQVFLSAGDCYALRCSILHEGSEIIDGQKARDVLRRIYFTTMPSHIVRAEDTLTLNVALFAEEMCQAVDSWASSIASNPAIQARICDIVTIRYSAFSPAQGIGIGP